METIKLPSAASKATKATAMEVAGRRAHGDDKKQDLPYAFYDATLTSKSLHFYLSSGIEAPELYVDMIHQIKTAGPNDTIYIYLNTPGGRIDTTIQIVNAMRITAARVVTVVESEAHSAGTMIFLAGDEFIVHDNAHMLFHNYSGGAYGKGSELRYQVQATGDRISNFLKDVYYPFLTEDEIDKLVDDKDIWMEAEEIRDRLHKMVEIMIAEKEADEKKAQAEEDAAVNEELDRMIEERIKEKEKEAKKAKAKAERDAKKKPKAKKAAKK